MKKIDEGVAAAVSRYADRFHDAVRDDHHVASPLGAWLLLALAGTAAPPGLRRELADVVGCDPETAAEVARLLLAQPHRAVAAAAALWWRPQVNGPAFGRWTRTLPDAVEHGGMPDQAGADQWADRHTDGMIKEFPIRVQDDTLLVLTTALATRIRWQVPFDVVSSEGLREPWAGQVSTALRAPYGHVLGVLPSAAGDVAVHAADSGDGLLVVSAIADPAVGRRAVIAAAHAAAWHLVDGTFQGAQRDLFDLPLGEGPAWTVRESAETVTSRDGRDRRLYATLPAWRADSRHDLLAVPAFGFRLAAHGLASVLPPSCVVDGLTVVAAQAATASYGREGFEAAAVTALALGRGAMPAGRPGRVRVAEIRFGHPYAVVAVARQRDTNRLTGRPRIGPWDGVPVFSAWVAQPAEA